MTIYHPLDIKTVGDPDYSEQTEKKKRRKEIEDLTNAPTRFTHKEVLSVMRDQEHFSRLASRLRLMGAAEDDTILLGGPYAFKGSGKYVEAKFKGSIIRFFGDNYIEIKVTE